MRYHVSAVAIRDRHCDPRACRRAERSNDGDQPGYGKRRTRSTGHLQTPPGTAEYQAWRDPSLDPPALVVQIGQTQPRYHLRCIDDLHAMLRAHGDWMPLGSADEQEPAAEGTVEAWGRSPDNPVQGWYGIKKGLRGRFGMYVPPVLEALGLAGLEDNPKNNRIRAK